MSRPRAVFTTLDVFWLMVAHGSRVAVATKLGVDAVTLRRHAADDVALQFAIDAGYYEYRRRTYPHGEAAGYKQGCRCDACTRANAELKQVWRARLSARLAEAPHGTAGGYVNWGCRCPPCTAAHSQQCKSQYQRRRALASGSPVQPSR